jgi:hypothetical protein
MHLGFATVWKSGLSAIEEYTVNILFKNVFIISDGYYLLCTVMGLSYPTYPGDFNGWSSFAAGSLV